VCKCCGFFLLSAVVWACVGEARAESWSLVFSDKSAPAEADDSGLAVEFTAYAWLTSFAGDAGASGLTNEVDETFYGIVDESDAVFGLMGAVDMVHDRFVFQINGAFTYAEFSDRETTVFAGPGGGGAEIDVRAEIEVAAAWFEALGGYRFVDEPLSGDETGHKRWTLDGYGGLRVSALDIQQSAVADATVTLPGGEVLVGGDRESLDDSKVWIEPFIGARLGVSLSERWNLSLRGDVGGFGVDGSDFSWQVIGAAGYRLRQEGWLVDLFGGYRALGQDYEDDGFVWDVVTHGPILGAHFVLFF